MEFAWEKLCGSIVQTWVYDVWWAQLSPDHGFPAQVGAAAFVDAGVLCCYAAAADTPAAFTPKICPASKLPDVHRT